MAKDPLKAKMTKAQARAFRRRWRQVNAHEVEELRSTSPQVRLQQFYTLLRWAKQFGWATELDKGDEQVRARWKQLREAFRG